jgi:hypothetical protein
LAFSIIKTFQQIIPINSEKEDLNVSQKGEEDCPLVNFRIVTSFTVRLLALSQLVRLFASMGDCLYPTGPIDGVV